MTRLKWDSHINVQTLATTIGMLIASIMLFAFSLKGKIDSNSIKIENIEKIEMKIDKISDDLLKLMLDMKDKADRKDG